MIDSETNLGNDIKLENDVLIDPHHLRTIFEDYSSNAIWYSETPMGVVDLVEFPIFWKRWWKYPFQEISRSVNRLTEYPSSSVFLLVLFTIFMWFLVGLVSSVAFVCNSFLSLLTMFPFLEFLNPGSAVNWGTISELEKWKLVYGDLTKSNWDIKNCEFFIRACALAYENPQNLLFDRITRSWNINFTRTAARESAQCHVWSFTKDREGYVVLVFKGTSPFNWNEWLTDATANPVAAEKITDNANATVHQGFYEALWGYKSKHWGHVVHQLNSACKDIPEDIEHIHIWITGHSLGAATATLATYRLLIHPEDITDDRAQLRGSYTFGTPRVGNSELISEVNSAAEKLRNFTMHRVINANDIITMIPFEDPAETYVFYGDAHYLNLKGDLCHWKYNDNSKKDPWHIFLRVRGLNLWFTFLEWGTTFLSLPTKMWSMKEFYNSMARLMVPFFLFDHYPSQYIEHLKEFKGEHVH